uniref:Uncharacterized protein n=1 Tax=Salarias fasciatus TaxID=181472 RepID=A0A672HB55_SALFA
MRSRCFLSTVDRLPTISEQQESDGEDGDPDCSHTMEEYVDSIKELSQPAAYPLHGPLRGHRRWTACRGAKPTALAMFLSSHRSHAPYIAIDPSEVTLTLADQSSCATPVQLRQNLLDLLNENKPDTQALSRSYPTKGPTQLESADEFSHTIK